MRVGEEEQWNEDEEPVVIVCYRDQLLENGDIYVTQVTKNPSCRKSRKYILRREAARKEK